jgi:hypothetical protein
MSDSKVKSVFRAMWRTFDEYRLRRLETSWFMVTREEQKQRLRALTRLILELEKIKAVSIQATLIGEGLIERVIEGDWKQVQAYHDDLVAAFNEPLSSETKWEGYQEHQEKHQALWEGFLMAAQTAIAESKRIAPGTRRGGN